MDASLNMALRKVADMINRKFYDKKCNISIGYYMDGQYFLTIGLNADNIRINFMCCSDGHVDIERILFTNPLRIFDTIIQDKVTGNYCTVHSYYEIIDNKIVVQSEYTDFCNKHLNLIFINTVTKYMYKYLHLCKTTHYLANLDSAYTLLLINKQRSHKIPIDVLKIIINKIFL